MAGIRISREAQADFDEIIDYLTTVAGQATAAKYGRGLQSAVNRLAVFPGLGTPRLEFGPRTRMWIVDPYLIFYDRDPTQDTVSVLRILHGRRRITEGMIGKGRT